MSATEYVILVNKDDQEIGTAEKLAAHKQCLLHRAFSVFIYKEAPEIEILLQQRADDKYHAGGLWTNTCCSHPRPSESILAAGRRRLKEELGLTAELQSLGWFHYIAHFDNGLSENEIDYVLLGKLEPDAKITLNPAEVKAYRWITPAELKEELARAPHTFTPWFEQALTLAQQSLDQI